MMYLKRNWMITNFSSYILESRKSIEDLEMLNPFELEELLFSEVRKYSPDFQYIKDIIAVGCPIDTRDSIGATALHYAALSGHLKIVKYLVSKGADIEARDDSGNTVWNFARREIIEYLLNQKK